MVDLWCASLIANSESQALQRRAKQAIELESGARDKLLVPGNQTLEPAGMARHSEEFC
jgi:hypothetical protein